MRIPPAVAKEIGSYYAAAHVNEAAAKRLAESGEYVASAFEFLAKGDVEAAASDAWSAAHLLARVATSGEERLDHGVITIAKQAYADATEAARLLDNGQGAGELRAVAARVSDAQALATQAAESWRYSAEQLAAEYL